MFVAVTPIATSMLTPPCVASNGTLTLERYSSVGGGKLLPGFLFMQGESDGLEQSLRVNVGGGRGSAIPFVPDDSCDDAIFEGASPDLRSPQLPYLKYDTWGCERKPVSLPSIMLESADLAVTIMPQFGGKVWSMRDKVAEREFFFSNPAHQPANIGARGAWTAGGLEFNWSPGFLGHSAFTEERVWAARLKTERGDVVRVYDFDRYNGTVFQVDLLLDANSTLWTHAKVTNPNNGSVLGYWWTCAAHTSTPGTRIIAPAEEVTVETYVGSPLRNAPWPAFDNGMLNSTFGGEGGERLVDSSYLGNIAYTGDYFLRVPSASRKWIAHVDDGGEYVAVHGHPLNGTKFFTWGQSGPGRFMQDFLAGGVPRSGDYTELQAGVTPTQQQVFTLDSGGSISFTEYYRPYRRTAAARGAMPADYKAAVADVGAWWDSEEGVPAARVQEMEGFFARLQDRAPTTDEIVSRGSEWGALHEALTGRRLAPGATFELNGDGPTEQQPSSSSSSPPPPPSSSPTAIWRELAERGSFSAATLEGLRAPLAYAVDAQWEAALVASAAAHGASWLHRLLLAVIYAEGGEVARPRELLQKAQAQTGGAASPVVARTLAVLAPDADAAWPHFARAWNLTSLPPPPLEAAEVTRRLKQNIADEVLEFCIGNLRGATDGTADPQSVWLGRLRAMSEAAQAAVGGSGSDTILVSRAILAVADGHFDEALALLSTECFPTLGRGRDVLLSLWRASVTGKAAAAKGRALSAVEAHRARKAAPVPKNIGCPYATLYCENYW